MAQVELQDLELDATDPHTRLLLLAEHWKREAMLLARDADRYRWLRAQHWTDNTIAAVRWPKDAMKLGHDAPSGERLDDLIDEAMAVKQENKNIAVFGAYTETNNQEAYVALDKTVPNDSHEPRRHDT